LQTTFPQAGSLFPRSQRRANDGIPSNSHREGSLVNRTLRHFALIVLLFTPCTALAEVDIPLPCRIKNRPPGRCGWCALETVARHQRVKALYGITEEHDSRSDPETLQALLVAKHIIYRIQGRGSSDTSILRQAIKEGRGVVVGFRELSPGSGGHIVTLVDFTEEQARVIDSNDTDRHVRTMPVQRFLFWWDGFALVVAQDGPKDPEPPATQQKGTTPSR
jgi:hypothetical protein